VHRVRDFRNGKGIAPSNQGKCPANVILLVRFDGNPRRPFGPAFSGAAETIKVRLPESLEKCILYCDLALRLAAPRTTDSFG
jgi:hypothetical protein